MLNTNNLQTICKISIFSTPYFAIKKAIPKYRQILSDIFNPIPSTFLANHLTARSI